MASTVIPDRFYLDWPLIPACQLDQKDIINVPNFFLPFSFPPCIIHSWYFQPSFPLSQTYKCVQIYSYCRLSCRLSWSDLWGPQRFDLGKVDCTCIRYILSEFITILRKSFQTWRQYQAIDDEATRPIAVLALWRMPVISKWNWKGLCLNISYWNASFLHSFLWKRIM